MSKKQTNTVKERKIFLNSLNSWFSNFVIEEFRTDYLPDAKIKYEFMGTMNTSNHPLPRLFEPKETKIELGYNYNQEVFTNDIFIYNLDDSNLAEVDFIIRGLKSLKYENEKTLILVSSIMTWAKTPLKTRTLEEMQSIDFNEEEFIPPKEEEEPKEEEKKEELKEDNPEQPRQEENKEQPVVTNKEEEKKSEPPVVQEQSVPAQNNTSQLSIDKINTNNPNGTMISEDNKLNQPQIEKKIFYYKESDYTKRIPNKRYFQYKILETQALTHNNPMLKVYIICPGFIYGCGEDFFFDYFKMAWLGRPDPIPIIEDGLNSIPTIHIMDLVQVIRRVVDKKPPNKYIFAVDKTKNPSMKNIIRSISKCMGSGRIQCLKEFNIDDVEIPNYSELSIDVKMKTSKLLFDERKQDEDIEDFNKRRFKWHCEYGIPENLDILRNEFNIYRNLKSVKILILGPPTSGKSEIAKKIATKLKLSHLRIQDIIEWAKNQSELSEEVKQKEIEIEEIVKQALEDYEKRKNKRKTDPPLDTTNLKKFPSEFLSKLIKARLRSSECLTKGYVLDGYPKKYQDCVDLFMENEQLAKDIIPDSVVIISNCTEESLKAKLKTIKGYEENMLEYENRFLRRYTEYKNNNEAEGTRKLNEFFDENKIDVFVYDDVNASTNIEEENEKMDKYLERNGPINNYERLCDEDEEEIIEDEENKPSENNEEKDGKVIIEEHKDDEEEFESMHEGNKSHKEEEKDIETKSKKSVNKNTITNDKNDSIQIPKQSSSNVANNQQSNENASPNTENKDDIKKQEEESKEQLIQQKLEELKEREKKLLEKKSEVLRRYLSENVIPLLAKGVLNVCQNMPDDPVEALANFLLDNSFDNLNKVGDSKEKKVSEKVQKEANNLENLNNNISNSSSNSNVLNKNISIDSNHKLNLTNSDKSKQ